MARHKKITGDDVLIEIAKLNYEKDFSQQDIARQFGISRALVSNLLKSSRQKGIVEIRVKDSSSSIVHLQRSLTNNFSLRSVVVVSSSPNPELAKVHVGRAAAALIEPLITDGVKIGISWGTTLYQLVEQIVPKMLSGVEVIQLHGGLGAVNPDIDGFGLARNLATKVRGRYRIIHAPAVVQSINLKKMLLKEPDISQTLGAGASVDIALFGIGSNLPEINALVRAGYLSEQDSLALLKRGAVGTVCGLHINAKGRVFPSPLNARLVGLDRAALLKIPVRLGVAAGALKTQAVLGAIRGEFVNMLVIDEDLAAGLLKDS